MTPSKSRLIASDGSVHLVGSSTDITEIKAREVRLQESLRENEIFRSLIDNVPVAIYAKRDDLKLFYVNKYWTQLTGFSSEDAVGKTDFEMFGENGLAFMEGDRAVLRTGQSQEIEETVDGSRRQRALPDRAQELARRFRRLALSARLDDRRHRTEAAREGAPGSAAPGGARRPRQIRIPGQYEPRDPHADERRARHGRTAGQVRPRPEAEDVHRDHRQVGQRAAHHHQRHPRLLEDRRRPAGARSGARSSSPRRSRTSRR